MDSHKTIIYKKDKTVASILLNRPDNLNAFSKLLRQELMAVLDDVSNDTEIRVLILGSTGKAFSSGADLEEGFPNDLEAQILQEYAPILHKIAQLDVPVIAAVPGVMVGIGAAFAMQCDLMVLADTGRLLLAFSSVGLIPDGGASWHLLQHLGYQRAYQLVIEGGSLTPEECLSLGIANKLVPADEVYSAAQAWAEALSKRSPIAMRETKKILRKAANLSYSEVVTLEAVTQNYCSHTEDSKNAIKAFFNKEKAVFLGK